MHLNQARSDRWRQSLFEKLAFSAGIQDRQAAGNGGDSQDS